MHVTLCCFAAVCRYPGLSVALLKIRRLLWSQASRPPPSTCNPVKGKKTFSGVAQFSDAASPTLAGVLQCPGSTRRVLSKSDSKWIRIRVKREGLTLDIVTHIISIVNKTVMSVPRHYLIGRGGSRHCPDTSTLNITLKHHVLRLHVW